MNLQHLNPYSRGFKTQQLPFLMWFEREFTAKSKEIVVHKIWDRLSGKTEVLATICKYMLETSKDEYIVYYSLRRQFGLVFMNYMRNLLDPTVNLDQEYNSDQKLRTLDTNNRLESIQPNGWRRNIAPTIIIVDCPLKFIRNEDMVALEGYKSVCSRWIVFDDVQYQ